MEEGKQQQQSFDSSSRDDNGSSSDYEDSREVSKASSSSEVDSSEFQSCASSEGQIAVMPDEEDIVVVELLESPRQDEIITQSSMPTNLVLVEMPSSSNTASSSWLEKVLFFGCGLGSSLGYIATLSALVYFKMLYGANSFVYLNVAVYFPLLPISLAQAKWDQYYDQQYRSQKTFLFRGMIGFSMILWGTIHMALENGDNEKLSSHQSEDDQHNQMLLTLSSTIRNALFQGTGGAILYGTLNQMASFVTTSTTSSNSDGSLKATVSAGVQASALLALALSFATGFHHADDSAQGKQSFVAFMWAVFVVEVSCFIMMLWVLLCRPLVTASMLRRDYSLQMDEEEDDEYSPVDEVFEDEPLSGSSENDIEVPLLAGSDNNNTTYSSPPLRRRLFASPAPQVGRRRRGRGRAGQGGVTTTNLQLSYIQLWQYNTKYCCLILMATLIPSFLVGSWFTQVKTSWMELAQVLFYVRIGFDFLGRLATLRWPPRTIKGLTWTATIRFIPVLSFFLNSKQEGWESILEKLPLGVLGRYMSDALSIILVAVIAFQSGYLVTGCFQLAPLGLPVELRESNQAKQASLLTVFFSASAILGLTLSFSLIALGV